MKLSALTTTILVGISSSVANASMTDSLSLHLDSVTVVSKRVTSSLKGSAGTTLYWDMNMMHDLPKILGNADPLHYAQLLPGVQTSSEYDAGLHIQGCDNSHNFVSIADVPVYNASHLLGLFSIFNASHFPFLRFDKTSLKASSANRLGGSLNMELPEDIPSKVNGEYSIGPMSAQGTLRIPTSPNSALFISARAAYLNLLYGQWLKFDNSQMKYHFQDYNLTYLYNIGTNDNIWFNLYYGDDNVGLYEKDTDSDTKLKWDNLLASARWQHKTSRGSIFTHNVYLTKYNNHFGFDMNDLNLLLPSDIYSYGYKSVFETLHTKAGIEAIAHHIQPQRPTAYGIFPIKLPRQPKERAQEYTCFIDHSLTIGRYTLYGGLKGCVFAPSNSRNYYSIDPAASLTYKINDKHSVKMSYGWQHQYLSKVGFSNMGLPTEFWLASGIHGQPQYSQNFSACYEASFQNGDYSVTVEAYYKDLYHQLEYNSNIFDFLTTTYTLDEVLLNGDGENYGVNVMLNKRTGKLTGWLSYAYGRAFRKFDSERYKGRYPASHERIHEFNAVATYQLNRKWSLGGTFVCASGTPFTAPKHFYLMNGLLVSEYGDYNANRLKPYCRLDISANYTFEKKYDKETGLNISLYNTLLYENDIFFRLKIHNSKFYYSPMHFIARILPSVSYYCKF